MSLTSMRDGVASETPPMPPSAEPTTKRILVVDDRPDTFESLVDIMRPAGPEWQVEFAPGGEAALAALAAESVDVLVVEDQMSGMDGVTLLTRARDRYPTTIRIILSGTSKPGLATIISHRFLSKPADVQELGVLIRRSCALHERTGQVEAFRKTLATTTLPSRPGVYMELNQVLSDPTWQPNQVSAVLERDVAMSAKVLQLANSALFGLASTIASVRDAVMYLGVDTIRSLALTAEAFGKLTPRNATAGFSIDEFQNHAMLVARITGSILPAGQTQQQAVTAALLHDIGKLVTVADSSDRWAETSRLAQARQMPLHEVELEQDGVSHADIGALLLSLWGLPDVIVEAVAHHHSPRSVDGLAFDGVAAVHIANALANELAPAAADAPPPAPIDADLVARLQLQERIDVWRERAAQIAAPDVGATAVHR
jgi:putative nucleotidyltransferase with HDIG domain